MFEEFYWIGIVFSSICVLGGIGMIISAITKYCFQNMKNLHTLIELQEAWRQRDKRKNHGP